MKLDGLRQLVKEELKRALSEERLKDQVPTEPGKYKIEYTVDKESGTVIIHLKYLLGIFSADIGVIDNVSVNVPRYLGAEETVMVPAAGEVDGIV